MSSHPGRSLIASAERKFGHLAIPHLIRWIGVFQFTVWGLALISPGFEDHLLLDQTKVYQGEIWRILTFVFVPRTTSPILILFAVFFLWFISDGIEQEWGPFRVNLYVLSTIACLVAAGLIPVFGIVVNVATAFLFFSAMFFAFAAIYPNQIINLFGVIPVKAKWLAFGNLGYLIYIVMQLPLFLLAVIAGLLPFAVVFLPGFIADWKRQSDAATRRVAFQDRVKASEGGAFHTCGACGKTDASHPELEFRVAADGEEYCETCLAERTLAANPEA
ncbi:MAG: hypothetical protein KDM64_05325 [Verrucomicrobiae bacterium]|nr:hypothetical protein [Verrucomicrobiae bacterium]